MVKRENIILFLKVAKFMEQDVAALLTKAKSSLDRLFGFKYLEKMAERNKIAATVVKMTRVYGDYLLVHNNIFKIMDFSK